MLLTNKDYFKGNNIVGLNKRKSNNAKNKNNDVCEITDVYRLNNIFI